jgi:catechol 2,3-dioxygenase-like lactoylglutathione lyase family enzyme
MNYRVLLPALTLALLNFSHPLAAQRTPARPAITGIAFMRVYESDPPAAGKFYRSLGYQPQTLGALERFAVNPHQWIEFERLPTPPPPGRMAEYGFTTADAATLEKYLKANGVAIAAPLHAGRFAVDDPEGNRVVFVQAGSFHEDPAQQAAASRAPSHRIIHVGFIVRDTRAEDAFYRQLLGFRPYWYGGMKDDALNFISLQVPDGTDWIEYMLLNRSANPDPEQRLRDFGMSDHFSLGVDQMSTVVAGLAANHCAGPNCAKTQMGRDGKVQLNVFDPDFTRIEYMEFKPSGPICCSAFTGKHPSAEDPTP